MKKQTFILVAFFLLFVILIAVGQYVLKQTEQGQQIERKPQERTSEQAFQQLTPTVKQEQADIKIDFGDGTIFNENVKANTVYDALVKAAEINKVKVEAKEYKYGFLVEKIANTANSADKFWTYYVNGKMGRIASDRAFIHPNDVIEWKYGSATGN